jgi:hypothetical protein
MLLRNTGRFFFVERAGYLGPLRMVFSLFISDSIPFKASKSSGGSNSVVTFFQNKYEKNLK